MHAQIPPQPPAALVPTPWESDAILSILPALPALSLGCYSTYPAEAYHGGSGLFSIMAKVTWLWSVDQELSPGLPSPEPALFTILLGLASEHQPFTCPCSRLWDSLSLCLTDGENGTYVHLLLTNPFLVNYMSAVALVFGGGGGRAPSDEISALQNPTPTIW